MTKVLLLSSFFAVVGGCTTSKTASPTAETVSFKATSVNDVPIDSNISVDVIHGPDDTWITLVSQRRLITEDGPPTICRMMTGKPLSTFVDTKNFKAKVLVAVFVRQGPESWSIEKIEKKVVIYSPLFVTDPVSGSTFFGLANDLAHDQFALVFEGGDGGSSYVGGVVVSKSGGLAVKHFEWISGSVTNMDGLAVRLLSSTGK